MSLFWGHYCAWSPKRFSPEQSIVVLHLSTRLKEDIYSYTNTTVQFSSQELEKETLLKEQDCGTLFSSTSEPVFTVKGQSKHSANRRGLPLSCSMHSTEGFLSEALASVPSSAWHGSVGHNLRVLISVAPLMDCVTGLGFFCLVTSQNVVGFSQCETGNQVPVLQQWAKAPHVDYSWGGEWCMIQCVPTTQPRCQLPVQSHLLKPQVMIMVKGDRKRCICLLTESRNKPHVIQRAAALPAPATSNSAKDMQEVTQ